MSTQARWEEDGGEGEDCGTAGWENGLEFGCRYRGVQDVQDVQVQVTSWAKGAEMEEDGLLLLLLFMACGRVARC